VVDEETMSIGFFLPAQLTSTQSVRLSL